MVERTVNVGDRVQPGQVVARLEPQNEMNALRAAEANLAAAEGQLVEANADFRRQRLSERGFAARAVFDRARQARQTAQSARSIAAPAQLKNRRGPGELHRAAAPTPKGW